MACSMDVDEPRCIGRKRFRGSFPLKAGAPPAHGDRRCWGVVQGARYGCAGGCGAAAPVCHLEEFYAAARVLGVVNCGVLDAGGSAAGGNDAWLPGCVVGALGQVSFQGVYKVLGWSADLGRVPCGVPVPVS